MLRYNCEFCEETFTSKNETRKHMMRNHNEEDQPAEVDTVLVSPDEKFLVAQRADVDKHWSDEETEFTPWLMENIELLEEEIGVTMNDLRQGEEIGRFQADIVGESGGRPVVIENQLTPSDHTHLGELMTYGTNRNAAHIVWIAPDFRQEHIRALITLGEEIGIIDVHAVTFEVFDIEDVEKPFLNFRTIV